MLYQDFIVKYSDRLNAVAQVLPELVDTLCAGKARGVPAVGAPGGAVVLSRRSA